jgi:hypothetical protein
MGKVRGTPHFLIRAGIVNGVDVWILRRIRSLAQLPVEARSVEEDLAQNPERGAFSAG